MYNDIMQPFCTSRYLTYSKKQCKSVRRIKSESQFYTILNRPSLMLTCVDMKEAILFRPFVRGVKINRHWSTFIWQVSSIKTHTHTHTLTGRCVPTHTHHYREEDNYISFHISFPYAQIGDHGKTLAVLLGSCTEEMACWN